MADRQRIVQVLNNLLANAARQSPETSPITVSAVREGVHVALSVSDAGRGVAPELVRERRPALVLPGADGIELTESLPVLADLPVIFISAYGRDETVVRALESGAADYIVKPFSPTELAARVRAALRVRIDPEPFVLGDLEIRHKRRRVTVSGREVRLTAIEYGILRLLSTRAGRPVTYETVLRHVWDGRNSGNVGTVRSFVKKLRAKLGEDAESPNWIRTERGTGYSMPRPDEAQQD